MKQDLKNLLDTATYQMTKWVEGIPVRNYTDFTARLSFDNISTLMACYTPEEKKVHVLCVAYNGMDGENKPMLGYQLYDQEAAVNNISNDSKVKGCEFHGGFTDVEKFLYAVENDITEFDSVTDAPIDEVLRFDAFKKIYESRGGGIVVATANYRIERDRRKFYLECVGEDICTGLKTSKIEIKEKVANELAAYIKHGVNVFDEHCAYELSHYQA